MNKSQATLAVLAFAFATSSHAAGPTGLPDALNVNVTNTPLPVTGTVSGSVAITNEPNVFVTNTPANAVPVTVIPSSPSPTVTCVADIGRGSAGSPYSGITSRTPLAGLNCPSNVSAIDLQSVFYEPSAGSLPSQNVASFWSNIGLNNGTGFTIEHLIAATSSGTPVGLVSPPVRLDMDDPSGTAIIFNGRCFSGIAGVNSSCGGLLYLVGTPVQ